MKIHIVLFLIMLIFSSCHKENSVSILYFNDAHEIMPVDFQGSKKGGVASLKYLVDSLKQYNKVFTVFGGDLAGGSLFGKFYRGFPMVEAFNKIPLDIANFGQHDFDFGLENTRKLVEFSDFAWLSSNLMDTNNKVLFDLPTTIIKNFGGIKIGFLGLTDKLITSGGRGDILQRNMIDSAKEAVCRLKSNNVDYIIAITQSPIKDNEKILENVPDINLILTEEVSEKITKILYYDSKYIISTIGNMGSVAEINLFSEGAKVRERISVHYLGGDAPRNDELNNLALRYQDSLSRNLSRKVGFALYGFARGCHRSKESALGNLIADAYRDYFNADIAMINAGGIRSSLDAGNISKKEVYSILPFDNKVGVVCITGRKLKDIIRSGLKNYKNQGGEFMQVSGISYTIKLNDKNEAMLIDVRFMSKVLNENRKYRVALPDYVINGGGGLPQIPKYNICEDKFAADTDVLSFYIQKLGEVKPMKEGRITIER